MIEPFLLFTYENELLKTLILDPLHALLNGITKYTTFPVGVLQFLVSKINFQPKLILTIFDDKELISSMCKVNTNLDSVMMNKLPKEISPTISIFPSSIPLHNIVYTPSEFYYHSTVYLVNVAELKDMLKQNGLVQYHLYTNNNKTRDEVYCELSFKDSFSGFLKLPKKRRLPIQIPLLNFGKINSSYNGIFDTIIATKGAVYYNEEEIERLFRSIKEKQVVRYSDVNIFKDFMRQKPESLRIYYHDSILGDHTIRTVALQMNFKSDFTHLVFYRYIEAVVDSILGSSDIL
jgi:hypothetical protein